MAKIGILTCHRERTCVGGKCFMAIRERAGVFRNFPRGEPLDVVGFISCGGCPGERLERAPAMLKSYGAEAIVLASCFLAGYPPCPYLRDFIEYIESCVGLPVVVGSHPMPTNYIEAHVAARDWERLDLGDYLQAITDDPDASLRYDSTRPGFLRSG